MRLSSAGIDFNPQVPCGTRRYQSYSARTLDNFNPQVPCGTRRRLLTRTILRFKFQSTGPLRDPTYHWFCHVRQPQISIHRSLAGPDAVQSVFGVLQGISIHRSLAGPDCSKIVTRFERIYFNPQVPCGTRRIEFYITSLAGDFNPQVPCGTRPGGVVLPGLVRNFNPQVPCGTRQDCDD